jgi:hypothetical protein
MPKQRWTTAKFLFCAAGCLFLLPASTVPGATASSAFDPHGFRPRCDFDPGAASANRILAWDGSNNVSIDVPASAHYRAGEGDTLSASGNNDMLRHLRLRDGHVEFDCDGNWGNASLQIELPGRSFRGFAVGGTGRLSLEKIKQPSLSITLAGATAATASGEVDHLNLSLAGSSKLGVGALKARSVNLSIAGSGDVETAPQDDIHINIAGSGTVRLVTEPRTVESSVVGSGRIIHPR